MTALTAWQNFYVIVGSSAGALIGLQFVVLSLISNRPAVRANAQAGQAFATPTIVHFTAVLVQAALMSAPWAGIGAVTIVWGAGGAGGMVYEALVIRRMRRQRLYKPEFEDWLFHAVLPVVAYLILAASAYAAQVYLREALFGAGAAVLLLLLIGIHNAWDAVTYHVFVSRDRDSEPPHGE